MWPRLGGIGSMTITNKEGRELLGMDGREKFYFWTNLLCLALLFGSVFFNWRASQNWAEVEKNLRELERVLEDSQ